MNEYQYYKHPDHPGDVVRVDQDNNFFYWSPEEGKWIKSGCPFGEGNGDHKLIKLTKKEAFIELL